MSKINSQLLTQYRNANDREWSAFSSGDAVAVGMKVTDGKRTRVQKIEGFVLSRTRRSVVVRRASQGGEGMEYLINLNSPNVDYVEVIRRGDVRQARIYYMRGRKGKQARIREKLAKDKSVKTS